MKVILHMGNYKTASSAIQGWLYRNRERLLDRGIYYGCCDGPPVCAHGTFTYRLLMETLEEMGLSGEYGGHPVFQYTMEPSREIWRRMVTEAKGRGAGKIVISHEAIFCEAFRTLNGLRRVPPAGLWEEVLRTFHSRLHGLVMEAADGEEAVVYLRRQDDYLESQYNQYCKMPWYEDEIRIPDFEEFYRLSPVMLDYRKPLGLLREVYGTENVYVKAFPYEISPYEEFAGNILGLAEREIAEVMEPLGREGAAVPGMPKLPGREGVSAPGMSKLPGREGAAVPGMPKLPGREGASAPRLSEFGIGEGLLPLGREAASASGMPGQAAALQLVSYGENRSFSYDAIEFKRLAIAPRLAANPEIYLALEEYSRLHPDRGRYTYFTPELRQKLEDDFMKKNRELPGISLPTAARAGRMPYPGLPPETMVEIAEFMGEWLERREGRAKGELAGE